jgi:hypothetical protein
MVGGGAGQLGIGEEHAAVVVRHNGCGGSHFGRGSTGVVVGSDEGGGVLWALRERKGHLEAVGMHTRGGSGGCGHRFREEDDWVGPVCQ